MQMSNEGRENNVNWDGIWDVATRIWPRDGRGDQIRSARFVSTPATRRRGASISSERSAG
jgi:hypothetical protein